MSKIRKKIPPTKIKSKKKFRRPLQFLDILSEALYGAGSRPSRLLMTMLGTVLGVSSLIVTVGLSQTASAQISKQFSVNASRQIILEPNTSKNSSGKDQSFTTLPWDSAQRVERLNGVNSAALLSEVDKITEVRTTPIYDPAKAETYFPSVFAADPGVFEVASARLKSGAYYDQGHQQRADRVVVLGSKAAKDLGINNISTLPSIFINQKAYTVIGIFDKVAREPKLLESIVVPVDTARKELKLKSADELIANISVGAGPLVAKQAPKAVDPNDPKMYKVSAPTANSSTQDRVKNDISVIFVILGIIALLAGGLGIANITMLSVTERIGEIGLRRALGATKAQIGIQFILESSIIGLLGGLVGSALGVLAVVIVAAVQQWTPVINYPLVIGGSLVGVVIGVVAGMLPARSAAKVEPVVALRSGV